MRVNQNQNKMKVMTEKTGKRGRPRKVVVEATNQKVKIQTIKMDDMQFNKKLFEPMKTGTKVDAFFSMEGGVMPGTNVVITGDPGVGKTTVLLDVLADLQQKGKKCLFVSGEMNAIDMVGYVKRFPKFGAVDILFMGDYAEVNPDVVLRTALKEGYDCVLIDSLAEISDSYVDYFGGTGKSNTNRILQLLDEHNLAGNDAKINTTFLIIQQVTKGGTFVGSNKIKHMTTAMGHLKFDGDGRRYFHFSKNRRGGNGNKLLFSLETKNKVNWLYDEPINGVA